MEDEFECGTCHKPIKRHTPVVKCANAFCAKSYHPECQAILEVEISETYFCKTRCESSYNESKLCENCEANFVAGDHIIRCITCNAKGHGGVCVSMKNWKCNGCKDNHQALSVCVKCCTVVTEGYTCHRCDCVYHTECEAAHVRCGMCMLKEDVELQKDSDSHTSQLDSLNKEVTGLLQMIGTQNEQLDGLKKKVVELESNASSSSSASNDGEIASLKTRLEVMRSQLVGVMKKAMDESNQLKDQLKEKDKKIEELEKKSGSSSNPDQDLWDQYKRFMEGSSGSTNNNNSGGNRGGSSGSGGSSSGNGGGSSGHHGGGGETEDDDFESRKKFLCNNLFAPGTSHALLAIQGRPSLRLLPKFNGNPADWPNFMRTFIDTTNDGNYSDRDNVPRLQKFLEGKALDLVKESLATSNEASRVMLELETIFGNTEGIVIQLGMALRHVPKITSQVDSNILKFKGEVSRYINTLKQLGREQDIRNLILLAEIEPKLGDFLIGRWHQRKSQIQAADGRDACFRDLEKYLIESSKGIQVRTQEDLKNFKISFTKPAQPAQPKAKSMNVHRNESSRSPISCFFCSGDHYLRECDKIREKPVAERQKFLIDNGICMRCLGKSKHEFKTCDRHKCSVCNGRHHELIHGVESQSTSNPYVQSCMHFAHSEGTAEILHKIMPVQVRGANGTFKKIFIMFDDCSSLTMIDKGLAQELQCNAYAKEKLTIVWTTGIKRTEEADVVEVEMHSMKGDKKFRLGEIHTCENLGLMTQTFKYTEMAKKFPYIAGFNLPDQENAQPLMLIGLRHASMMQISDRKMPKEGEFGPILSMSNFGWIVWGPTALPSEIQQKRNSINCHTLHVYCQRDDDTERMVREYFDREDMGIVQSPKLVSADTKRSLEIMNSTIKFTNGRYEIGLLWRDDDVTLPDNFREAVRRMYSDEKRLKQLGLVEWKSDLIHKHIANGEVRKATKKDLETNWRRISYGPQFVTINKNKEPPKPRNVVDVKAQFNGVSLNSCLLKGPDNLSPLLKSLMRLRENKIAYTADVKAMFHQIRIREEDQQCQRFLFRDGDNSKEPKDCIFIFQSMMFGPTCSPTIAQFVKNFHADKFRESHPKAHRVITEFTYVDDSSDSQPTIDDASESAEGAIHVYREGGFELVGFQSNSVELLKRLPRENVKIDLEDFEFGAGPECEMITKILGMHWSTTTDEFFFKRRTDENLKQLIEGDVTKRRLLRMIMQIFDPFGFLQLLTIRGRQLIQEIWKIGYGWDENVDESIRQAWLELHEELNTISNVRIPRQFAPINPEEFTRDLVTFVDASDKVYTAITFLLFQREEEVHVSFVTAKARLRGTKYKSIPKMELDAAVLGVRQAKSTSDWLSFDITSSIFLSDSRTVLCWISSTEFKFNAYVEPRIAEILDATTVKQWFHVPSKENVADDGTKWTGVRQIDSNDRWFKGPSWMHSKFEDWPITPAINFKGKPSEPNEYHFCAHSVQEPTNEFDAVEKVDTKVCETWQQFLHKVAVNQATAADDRVIIGVKELDDAEKLTFRKIQSDSYRPMMLQLKTLYRKKDMQNMSKTVFTDKYNDIVPKDMLEHRPFVDDDGLLRKFSRSQHAQIPYAMKYPIILDSKHPLTEFLVSCLHRANLHCLDQNVIADLNEIGLILNARSCLKRVKEKCEECIRFKASPKQPFMGDLHPTRVDYEEPAFTNVGIDAFGPYLTKFKRGTDKKWGLIFTCLTYRAVHIQVLDSMSMEDCMLAIRNFLALTGGVSKKFCSDNGTNFVGSNNLIVKDFIAMQKSLGEAVAREKRIDWDFIPAYSPWMGGAWERMIGSVKKCLQFTLNSEVHDVRILKTTLNEIAALLNRRPLTHVPADPADGHPFTPNSMLIGNKNNDLDLIAFDPQPDDESSSHMYRRAEHLARKCMRRFVREYLPGIASREKWYVEREVNVGDECILFDKDVERRLWKKCVVTKTHPGRDGVVRVVDIETLEEEKPKKYNYRSVGNLIFTGINNAEQQTHPE